MRLSKNNYLYGGILFLFVVFSQGSDQALSGYVKNVSTLSTLDFNRYSNFNYLHNRLNYRVDMTSSWQGALEIRNRLFYGDNINPNGLFTSSLEASEKPLAMSKALVDKENILLFSEVDRAYIRGNIQDMEITIGRQRINWGVNLAWTPNDLFNVYNYTDFEYSERAGTDGVKVEYYLSELSSIQWAFNIPKKRDSLIVAALYKWNQWNYDIQILLGNYHKDGVLGMGWAGNLYNGGLKGELSWFEPHENRFKKKGVVTGAVSLDYFFEKPFYILGSFLFNSQGAKNQKELSKNYLAQSLSPKNLMPTRYNLLLQGNWMATPLWVMDLSTIYTLGVHGIYVLPSLSYSLSENGSLSLLYQGWFSLSNDIAVLQSSGNILISFNF